MPMSSNSFVINSCWCYPAVQHLTTSGGKGIPSSPGEKNAMPCTYARIMLLSIKADAFWKTHIGI